MVEGYDEVHYASGFQPGFRGTLGLCQYSPGIPQVYNLELGSSKLVSSINAQGSSSRWDVSLASASPQRLKTTAFCVILACSFDAESSTRLDEDKKTAELFVFNKHKTRMN